MLSVRNGTLRHASDEPAGRAERRIEKWSEATKERLLLHAAGGALAAIEKLTMSRDDKTYSAWWCAAASMAAIHGWPGRC